MEKMEKMEKFKKYLSVLKPSPIKFLVAFVWFTVFLLLADAIECHFLNWVSLPGLVYMVIGLLTLVIYGLIINPIKDWKSRVK